MLLGPNLHLDDDLKNQEVMKIRFRLCFSHFFAYSEISCHINYYMSDTITNLVEPGGKACKDPLGGPPGAL